MSDPKPAAPKLDPIDILDYRNAGRKVYEWATDPASRPADMQQMRDQLDGLVKIPPRYESLRIDQGDDTLFVLRLPPKNQVEQSKVKVEKEKENAVPYEPPAFYGENFSTPGGMDNVEFFFSRLADYTIRGCK